VGGGRLLMANPNEATTMNGTTIVDPAFTTLINTSHHSIIGDVLYDEAAHAGLPATGHGFSTFFADTPGGPLTQHGLEQPTFLNGKFYLNVPATIQNPGGEIDVFEANAAKITAVFPLLTCGGTGLDVGPRNDLVVECGDSARLIDANGFEEARFVEFGGSDELWSNRKAGLVYFALPANTTLGRPLAGLGVLDAVHNESLGVTPIAGAQGLHSVAADANTGRIFVPSSDNPDTGGGGVIMMRKAGRSD
jgi:hypothetical protein